MGCFGQSTVRSKSGANTRFREPRENTVDWDRAGGGAGLDAHPSRDDTALAIPTVVAA